MLKVRAGNMKGQAHIFTDEMFKLFKAEIDNFFDRKAYYDFRHFDLEKLDIELLSSKSEKIKFEDKVQEKLA